jgi:lipopolysaccharide transport system permease protein
MRLRQHQVRPLRSEVRDEDKGVAPREIETSGGPGRLNLASLSEFYEFRGVQQAFVARQLKVRYKQAVLGAGWAVLQPLGAAAIFTLFLGRYAQIPSEGAPYLLFALIGLTVWTYFSSAVTNGSDSLVGNQSLLRKLYFPREILPISPVLAGLADLGAGLGVVVAASLLYGITPTLAWIALPLPVLILIVFSAAFCLGSSALNLFYRDVRYVLPFLIQLGLFASPIVYPLALIPARWREIYAVLNPVAGAVDSVRRIMLHGKWPQAWIVFGALVWSLLLLVAAYALFKRLERSFADRV